MGTLNRFSSLTSFLLLFDNCLVCVLFAFSLFFSPLFAAPIFQSGAGSMTFLTEMLQFALLGAIRPTARVDIDGDFIVGGLFPVHEKGNWTPCGDIMEGRGLHRVAAMIYAIERINNDSTLLPGIKLGMSNFPKDLKNFISK